VLGKGTAGLKNRAVRRRGSVPAKGVGGAEEEVFSFCRGGKGAVSRGIITPFHQGGKKALLRGEEHALSEKVDYSPSLGGRKGNVRFSPAEGKGL